MNEPLITVIGNVVADPELRMSQAGKPWVTFRVASTPRVKDRDGNWGDGEALWLGCRAYGDHAENIAKTLVKGLRVIVQGRLSSRSYTDNQGQQRTSLDLEVEAIGPELRFASAQVTRAGSRGQGGDFAPRQVAQDNQASNAWGQASSPQNPLESDPWPQQPSGGFNADAEQAW